MNSVTESNAEGRRIAVSILLFDSCRIVYLLDQRFSSVLWIRICSMWNWICGLWSRKCKFIENWRM